MHIVKTIQNDDLGVRTLQYMNPYSIVNNNDICKEHRNGYTVREHLGRWLRMGRCLGVLVLRGQQAHGLCFKEYLNRTCFVDVQVVNVNKGVHLLLPKSVLPTNAKPTNRLANAR